MSYLAFRVLKGATQEPGERKMHQYLQATVTLQVIKGHITVCDTAVMEVTKYPDWIGGLPHRKESMPSPTDLAKTPGLRR